MEEQELASSSVKPNSNPKLERGVDGSRILCEECNDEESKYTCPGCSVRSCSLPCVKSHKLRTGCTGKRNRTESIPISCFTDDDLLSDYNLLEEIKRVSESAQRMRFKLGSYPNYRLPFHLKNLRSAAYSGRRINLLLLPSGMSKRERNQTRYHHKKKCIFWTIEWRFHSTDVVLLDHGIDENRSISSIIGSHLKPGPWSHKLKKFCDQELDSLKFFIRKFQKGSKSPFYELDSKVSLRQQLANLCILEYPVIYVFLASHSIDFEVLKQIPRPLHKPQNRSFANNNKSIPEGVPFKEEQIEENGDLFDPQEVDLLKPGSLSVSSSGVLTNEIEKVLFEDMEYDFDQGLIDAYSDLMAEVNPDGFLDFEGFLGKKDDKTEEGEDIASDSEEILIAEDELEEGEIAE